MSDNTYSADILLWSKQQSGLLREVAAGKRPNATPDWTNIADEIESVGRSQLAAVRSLLIQALVHDLKAEAWPLARDVPNWRADARGFRQDAADNFSPSMRQHLDVSALYAKALKRLPETMDGQAPSLPVPTTCPVTLDELLNDDGR